MDHLLLASDRAGIAFSKQQDGTVYATGFDSDLKCCMPIADWLSCAILQTVELVVLTWNCLVVVLQGIAFFARGQVISGMCLSVLNRLL